jgi:hypothetical protein
MDNAKIAAGVDLKFLGKRTYPEKCPFAAGYSNKFSLRNATKNFLMSGWTSHVRLLPDYSVSPVIVRMPDFQWFSKNIAPTFLGNFSSRFQNFRWQKIPVALTTKIRLIFGIANEHIAQLFRINRIAYSTYSDKKAFIFVVEKFVADSLKKLIIFRCCAESKYLLITYYLGSFSSCVHSNI